jgi:hypothetical protein
VRPLVPALAAAAAVALVGCGSGAKGLSQHDFVTQANAICASADSSLKKVPQPTGTDVASLVPYAQAIEDRYQAYLTRITALATQARDKTTIQGQWITPATQDFAREKPLLDQLVAAAQKRDTNAIKSVTTKLQAITDHTVAIQQFQRQYGATTCATLLDDVGT